MTDEEMAEEYANTVKCEWENDTYWVDCRDEVTDAYLAGLKAGKPKWHKVADGDLPDIECSVLIYCIGGYRIEKYYKDKKLFGEFSLNFVHGWQYLPDYIEEYRNERYV